MKNTLLAALAVLALTTFAHAGDFPEKQLWANYAAAKAEAKTALTALEAGNTETATLDKALGAFTATSTTADLLDRQDIVAWQLNNYAFAQVTWFKHAGYNAQMERLAKMPAGKDKPAAIADAKATLTPLFQRIEASATAALSEAAKLTKDEATLTAIRSNQAFLVWVARFIESK